MTMSTLQDELALVRGFVDGNKKQPKEKTETEGQEEATDDKPTEGECGSVVVKMETDQENKETSPSEEPAYVILDYQEGDDMSEMTRKNLPRYDPQRSLGISFVTEFSCKHCSLCKKLFDCDEAAEVHLKTYKHFKAFSKLIRSKGMIMTVQGKSHDEVKRKHDNSAESETVDESKRIKLENGDETPGEVPVADATCADSSIGDENWETEENIEEAIDSAVADNTEIDESILDEPVVEEAPLPVPAPEIPPVIPSVNSPSIGRGRGRGARGRRGGIASNKNKI